MIDAEACVLDEIGPSDFTGCISGLRAGLPLVEQEARPRQLPAGVPDVLFVGGLPAQAEIFAERSNP